MHFHKEFCTGNEVVGWMRIQLLLRLWTRPSIPMLLIVSRNIWTLQTYILYKYQQIVHCIYKSIKFETNWVRTASLCYCNSEKFELSFVSSARSVLQFRQDYIRKIGHRTLYLSIYRNNCSLAFFASTPAASSPIVHSIQWFIIRSWPQKQFISGCSAQRTYFFFSNQNRKRNCCTFCHSFVKNIKMLYERRIWYESALYGGDMWITEASQIGELE